jgi:hypothetical protein
VHVPAIQDDQDHAHDYDGCWGTYWTDAIDRAIVGWNSHGLAFQTRFSLQKVTSGEHARILFANNYESSLLWGYCLGGGSTAACE